MTADTRPLDRKELKPCALCGKGVMHTGSPIFYEMTFGQCVADMRSIQQQHGLEQMMGGAAALAQVFAPSTVVAHRMPPVRHLVCTECAMEAIPPLAFIDERDDTPR